MSATIRQAVPERQPTSISRPLWHGSMTGAFSATCARATASCTKANAAVLRAQARRRCDGAHHLRPLLRFCVDPIEKKL